MLISLISHLFKLSFRNNYHAKTIIISEIISIYTTLVIYWFTSKAFTSSVDQYLSSWGGSYFNYLFVGELFLIFPTFLFQHFSENIKVSLRSETFDTFMHLPINKFKSTLILGLGDLPTVLWRIIIMLLMGVFFFGFEMQAVSIIEVMSIQIIAIPSFLGLGFIGVSLLVLSGRGQGLINYVCLGASFMSGAYFPLQVLPKIIQDWGLYLSPFSSVIIYTRKIITQGSLGGDWTQCLVLFLLTGCVFLLIGVACLSFALARWKCRPDKLIILR